MHSKPTLLESASQPAPAIRIQIILAFVPSGTHCTVWEGGLFTPERFALSQRSSPEAPFDPSAGKIQHPCSDACSSDEPTTGASSNHLLFPVGDVGSADFISVQYRQRPIPASDHRIYWPLRPVVVGIYRVPLRVLYLLPASGGTCPHSEVAGPVAVVKIGAPARPSSLPHATINPFGFTVHQSFRLVAIPEDEAAALSCGLSRS